MTQRDAENLAGALRQQLNADVEVHAINGDGRYRFAVISPDFHQMDPLQRQDAVWAVVDATLPRGATLDVSLILAFAPSEVAEAQEPT